MIWEENKFDFYLDMQNVVLIIGVSSDFKQTAEKAGLNGSEKKTAPSWSADHWGRECLYRVTMGRKMTDII